MGGIPKPFRSWALDAVQAVADGTGFGLDAIHSLPVFGLFHFAMLGYRKKWERLEDARLAASFAHFDDPTRRQLSNKIGFMLSGPGIPIWWEDTLTERQKIAAKQSEEELEVTYQKFKRMGILLNADGSRPVGMILGKG